MYRNLLNIISIYSLLFFFLIYNCLNVVNVSADFMFSGKAFNIITPVYEMNLWCVLGTYHFLLAEDLSE